MGIWVGSKDDKVELYVGSYNSYGKFVDDLCEDFPEHDPAIKLLRQGPVWTPEECTILYLFMEKLVSKKLEASQRLKTWNWKFYYFQVIEPEEGGVRDDIVKFTEGLKYCAETDQGTMEL